MRAFTTTRHDMSLMKQLFYSFILALLLPLTLHAQWTVSQPGNIKNDSTQVADKNGSQSDSLTVSLLTCTPGSLVYELYGHTALRVRESGHRQSDWVFNYGSFSFEQPHFMWRFMLGETDYELCVVPYTIFYDAYVREGRGIEEQVLNLTPREAERLVDALSENLDPKNATYRYNFFYDNCTTRALRIVERCIDGKVVWPKATNGLTLRDVVHEFSKRSPWNKFGQDILLGNETDTLAGVQAQMFAPVYAERYAEQAMIIATDGTQRHLVAPSRTLLPAIPGATGKPFPITPMWAFSILLVFTLTLTAIEWKRKKNYWQYDALLFVAQGLTGCIVSFLFFFSAHPGVSSNWLVTLFNPLPLISFAWLMKADVQGRRSWGTYVQAAMLCLALLTGLCGLQHFPAEVYLIIALLSIRVVAQFYNTRQKAA